MVFTALAVMSAHL